ncbi:uncharacterized protein TOT_010000231 [Theileria orientalis strain Shintoku]|uniref:Uncharacterized protein n=1 Tax=Theileria orientalis strain Shintoku TaxID=869250 RepID=J7MEV8_THEOR|nr:uncharacterized protein TOT_010000231 [Theileria orientalis strain Shintoku]PVC52368.1 hypothetical protein MACL_00000914 [Theileria orientalis]BAM38764.1 uncharacterized protein TOT_010000231 [Theileria orientalis strain Shintoku]|eukprot:XP_009689065.1 uncharacterized protein TOT_010000231 [Theileria orientalis strain Shintoku]
MSRAVYSKLWMSTSQFHLRRQYGWTHVCKRLTPWVFVVGFFGVWTYFPTLSNENKKRLTLGLWNPPTVGYFKFLSKEEE